MTKRSSLVLTKREILFCSMIKKHDLLGAGTLQPLWLGPHVVKKVLSKGAYKLQDSEGVPLKKPRNGLYLKKYYASYGTMHIL